MTETRAAGANTSIPFDDGTMDLTPAFVANYVLGEQFVRIRVGFSSISLHRAVRLSPDGYVKVNGTRMESDFPRRAHEQVVSVPLGDARLHVELVRSGDQKVSFEVALPLFKVERLPTLYRHPERLNIRMAQPYLLPAASVAKDDYGLEIRTGSVCHLKQEKAPTADDPELIVRPILERMPQPMGRFEADLFRIQRTPLSRITSMFKTGWFATTVTEHFSIEVLG